MLGYVIIEQVIGRKPQPTGAFRKSEKYPYIPYIGKQRPIAALYSPRIFILNVKYDLTNSGVPVVLGRLKTGILRTHIEADRIEFSRIEVDHENPYYVDPTTPAGGMAGPEKMLLTSIAQGQNRIVGGSPLDPDLVSRLKQEGREAYWKKGKSIL